MLGTGAKTIIITAFLGARLVPHTFLLDKYRKFRARYGLDGNEVPVRKDIQQKFQEVLDYMKLSERKRNNIKLFNVHDINMFHAGELWTAFGSAIGIPANFEYKDPNSISDQIISFQMIPIDWSSETAEEFRKSLVLSDNAQKFAMAETILSVSQFDLLYKTVSLTIDMILGLQLYSMCTSLLRITEKQKLKKMCLMITVIFAIIVLWFYTNYERNKYNDLNIMQELTESFNLEYIKGGAEYYEKMLNVNKALRVLLGEKGTYLYTPTGEEASLIGNGTLPLSEKMDYYKSKLENF